MQTLIWGKMKQTNAPRKSFSSPDIINHKVFLTISSNREFLWSSAEDNVAFITLIFHME